MTAHIVHASRMQVAKAGSSKDGVHRLEDIEVQEVSLVDRPANKRAFLIVKRSDEMTTQVTPDGKGGFTATANTAKADPPMPPGAPGAAPGAPPKKKPGKIVGKLDVPPGFKEMMAPMLAKASEALSALADAVDSSSPAEIGDDGEMPTVPAEFSDALSNIMGTLDKLAGMWPSAPAAPEEGAAEEAPTEMQMRATLDNVGKVLGSDKVVKAVVLKVGAKMAKDRFARLQTAYNQLGALIGELGPAMAPAGAPPAGGAALGKAGKADEKAEKEKAEKANAELVAKFEALLAPIVDGLKSVGVAVTKQQSDIVTLQKSRGAGNAARVEKSGGSSVELDHSWPLDMNAPVTKETVSKTESFFGED